MSAAGGLTVLVCDERPHGEQGVCASAGRLVEEDRRLRRGIHVSAQCRVNAATCMLSPVWSRTSARMATPLSCAANLTKPVARLVKRRRRNRVHRIARRKNDQGDGIPAHLTEAARQWVMLDIDGWPLPPGACLRTDPAPVIDEAIHALLPEPFHDAECFWQLSSSAGLRPWRAEGASLLLAVRGARQCLLAGVVPALRTIIDIAPFNAVQPHYIADPKIEGGDDPLPVRTGWRHGAVSEVTLPPLPDVADRRARTSPILQCQGRHGRLARREHRGRPGATWRWRRIGRLPSTSVGGIHAVRHPCDQGGDTERCEVHRGPASRDRGGTEAGSLSMSLGYLDEVYLQRIIDGAFHLIDNAAKSDTPTNLMTARRSSCRQGSA